VAHATQRARRDRSRCQASDGALITPLQNSAAALAHP
jgi:hypothetical protein